MAPESDKSEKKKSDNRWWEFYFVRYFVGTAIGAIIILFLATADSPFICNQDKVALILKSLKPEKFESGYLALLAAIGLAFCYIASAPILVFHATRGSLLAIRKNFKWRHIIWPAIFVFGLTAAQGYDLWRSLRIIGNPLELRDFYAGIQFMLLISIIFVSQMYLLWISMFSGEQKAYEYYDNLVKRRAEANDAGQQYIESYRHLREHGNAFFIALLELLLGAALYYSPAPWAVLLMLWILPSVGVWFFGTYMENRNF